MAQGDMFLKFDGIEGESQDGTHKNAIDILHWSFGVSNVSSVQGTTGGTTAMASHHDVTFTAYHSKASPRLYLAVASGSPIKHAVLTCRKAGGGQQEYLVYKFSDCYCTSWHVSGSDSGNVLPIDTFTLSYAQVEMEYKPQKADGSLDSPVKTGWNLKQNKKK